MKLTWLPLKSRLALGSIATRALDSFQTSTAPDPSVKLTINVGIRGDFGLGDLGLAMTGEIDVMFGPKVVMPARCIYNLVHTCSYYLYMVYYDMLPCGRPFWHLYTYIISIYTYLKIYQYIVRLPIYIHVSHTYIYIYIYLYIYIYRYASKIK